MRLELLPAQFAEVLEGCIELADPPLRDEVAEKIWDPVVRAWS